MRKILSFLLLMAIFAQMAPLSGAHARPNWAVKSVQESRAAVTRLRNQDVLEMLKAGLSVEVVVAKINISSCDFDTSSVALQQLKAAGVPDQVVLAMLRAAGRALEAQDASVKANARPVAVEVRVPDSTLVEIEAAHTITSADVEPGSALSFRVASPVRINGLTVISVGALATGRVVTAKKGRHWGRAGRLTWKMESVEAVDGHLIALQAESGGRRGVARKGEVATKTVVTGILLIPVFPLAPLALLHGYKRGADAVLSEGTRYTVFVRGEANINALTSR